MEKLTKITYTSLSTTIRVGCDGYYYVIVPDNASGRKGRYTVYRLPSSSGGMVRIVGREVPLGLAQKLIGSNRY